MSDIKTRILLPKGRAMEACTSAVEQELGAEFPRYDGDCESSQTSDYDVFWLKPKDIGGLIAKDIGDIGCVGTDVVTEYIMNASYDRQISSKKVKDQNPMCRFSVLGLKKGGAEEIEIAMDADGRYASRFIYLPTAYPKTLTMAAGFNDLPFLPYNVSVSGCVEVYAKMLGAPGVADLVQTGRTAEKNGLVECVKLLDVYPEILTRRADNEAV